MKFFYADSLDLVDPRFDFIEERSTRVDRIPQRDDVYAHELMTPRPYDGILVSKSLFREGGGSTSGGKYSVAQRHRFLREGAQKFLRFPPDGTFDDDKFPILGDCGAFAYKDEEEPPYTIDEIVEFYEVGGFTHGISLDHLILQFDRSMDVVPPSQWSLPQVASSDESRLREAHRRFDLTLQNASKFLARCQTSGVRFTPLGAAQGWSPASYRKSVRALLGMGYKYVAIGGLVPLKTSEIRAIVDEVRVETGGKVPLHLLGVTRLTEFTSFQRAGVVSFDSSSPVIQAFMDARDNYYSSNAQGHYTAVRVPQSDGPRMLRRIREGVISQSDVVRRERDAMTSLRAYASRVQTLDDVLAALQSYDELAEGKSRTRWDRVRRTLSDRPWEDCTCSVCQALGVDVIIFRGANRNRRRGFHNLWWTHEQLRGHREVLTS